MDYDRDKVDEMVMALLYLTIWEEAAWGARAWKSHDWDVLDRGCQAGLRGAHARRYRWRRHLRSQHGFRRQAHAARRRRLVPRQLVRRRAARPDPPHRHRW